jgi:hypothetical protein
MNWRPAPQRQEYLKQSEEHGAQPVKKRLEHFACEHHKLHLKQSPVSAKACTTRLLIPEIAESQSSNVTGGMEAGSNAVTFKDEF